MGKPHSSSIVFILEGTQQPSGQDVKNSLNSKQFIAFVQ